MRYGKKLFLLMDGDTSGAPYISNKALKEILNQAVRELRQLEQANLKFMQIDRNSIADFGQVYNTMVDANEVSMQRMQNSVRDHNLRFFQVIDEDLEKIRPHAKMREHDFRHELKQLRQHAQKIRITMSKNEFTTLEKQLGGAISDRHLWVMGTMQVMYKEDRVGFLRHFNELITRYNSFIDAVNLHFQYIEVNVAGYRKLLKRHDRQIPKQFHNRQGPFIGYHALAPASMMRLREHCVNFHNLLACTHQFIENMTHIPQLNTAPTNPQFGNLTYDQQVPDLVAVTEVKEFGAETSAVVNLQGKLRGMTQRMHTGKQRAANWLLEDGNLYEKQAGSSGETLVHHQNSAASFQAVSAA